MNILRYIISLLIVCQVITAFSQEKAKDQAKVNVKPSIKDRLVFGGSLGAQVGSVTSVYVSPSVGFYFTPRIFGGTSLSYQYYYEKWLKSKISSHIFGSNIFGEYAIIDNIGKNLPVKADFALISHLEYELLNLDHDFSNSTTFGKVDRFWLHGVLVGGGVKQKLGKNSSINITILYNLLWNERTPYSNPLIRIGVYL